MIIPPAILAKIGQADHGSVTAAEVEQCFLNHCGKYCTEHRPERQASSGAPTYWFVGETNHRRRLKVMFVLENGNNYLKSAYPATASVEMKYQRFAK